MNMFKNGILLLYLPYAAIAITLTVWLARTLSRHGEVFLKDVFPTKPALATALNQLLVIGFYLVNLGWALLLLQVDHKAILDAADVTEILTSKLGLLLLLLGAAHLVNLMVFHRIRRGSKEAT